MTLLQWARVLRAGASTAGNRPDVPLTTGMLAEVLSVMGRTAVAMHHGTATDGHPQLDRPYSDAWAATLPGRVRLTGLPCRQSRDGMLIDVPPGWRIVQVVPCSQAETVHDAQTRGVIMCLIEPVPAPAVS